MNSIGIRQFGFEEWRTQKPNFISHLDTSPERSATHRSYPVPGVPRLEPPACAAKQIKTCKQKSVYYILDLPDRTLIEVTKAKQRWLRLPPAKSPVGANAEMNGRR
jgi:hypothetical protein